MLAAAVVTLAASIFWGDVVSSNRIAVAAPNALPAAAQRQPRWTPTATAVSTTTEESVSATAGLVVTDLLTVLD